MSLQLGDTYSKLPWPESSAFLDLSPRSGLSVASPLVQIDIVLQYPWGAFERPFPCKASVVEARSVTVREYLPFEGQTPWAVRL